MKNTITRYGIALLVSLGLGANASAQCMYEYIPLPLVQAGGSSITLTSKGIGVDDTIVGFLNLLSDVPGIWTPGDESLTFLTLPEGFAAGQALGIYDARSVVGYASRANPSGRNPFFWRNGVPEPLPRGHPEFEAFPNAINRHLHIVGEAGGPGPEGEPPFFRPAIWIDGEYSEILNLPIGRNAAGLDINDRGEIVGWMGLGTSRDRNAFHWVDGVATDLGLFSNGVSTRAFAINNLGLIVGSGFDNGLQDNRPLHWRRGIAIPLPVPKDFIGGTAFDVNDGGQIVGRVQLSNFDLLPSLWQHGQFHDLNDLVINAPTPLAVARAINNRGVISMSIGILVPIDSPPGDVDHDCKVGVEDLLLMLGQWNNEVSFADINADGIVDVWDLLEVLSHWGMNTARGKGRFTS